MELLLRINGKRSIGMDEVRFELARFSPAVFQEEAERMLKLGGFEAIANGLVTMRLSEPLEAEQRLLTLIATRLAHNQHSLRISNRIEILADGSSAFGLWLTAARKIIPNLRLFAAPNLVSVTATAAYLAREESILLGMGEITHGQPGPPLSHEFIHAWVHRLTVRNEIEFPYFNLTPTSGYEFPIQSGRYKYRLSSDEFLTWTFALAASIYRGSTEWQTTENLDFSRRAATEVFKALTLLAEIRQLLRCAVAPSVDWQARKTPVHFELSGQHGYFSIWPVPGSSGISAPQIDRVILAARIDHHNNLLIPLANFLSRPPVLESPQEHAEFWRTLTATSQGLLQKVLDLYLKPGVPRLDAEALLRGAPKFLEAAGGSL